MDSSVKRRFDVVAVGDLNIDLILGIEELPTFGREVLAHSRSRHAGGVAANFASYCARLGLRVALVARVGADEEGRFLIARMEEAGVGTDYILRDPSLPTGLTISLSGPHDRAFVTYLGTIDSLTGADIPESLLAQTRWLHVGSYFMQTKLQPDLPLLFERATRAGVTVSLDTGYDPSERWDSRLCELLPHTDLFLPNEVEICQITHTTNPLRALSLLPQPRLGVALKLGAEGSCFSGRDANGRIRECAVPAFMTEVVDTTCCGDAFNAGFIAAWLESCPPEECLRWGNALGAIVASGSGNMTHAISREALQKMLMAGTLKGQKENRAADS